MTRSPTEVPGGTMNRSHAHRSRLFAGIVSVVLAALTFSAIHAQDAPTVVAVPTPGSNALIIDPSGYALYTWDGDGPGVSNCVDDCSASWLPYTIEGAPTAPTGL